MDEGDYEAAEPFLKARMEADYSDYNSRNLMLSIFLAEGNLDEAKALVNEYCENNESENGDSDTGYILNIRLLRAQGKTEEAKALADEAAEIYSTVAEIMRQQALIALVEGDYATAYEKCYDAENIAYYMYQYYGDSSQLTDALEETLCVASNLLNKQGGYDGEYADDLAEIVKSYDGTNMGENVQKIISGELDVNEVLTKGVCDF